jgi:hypothetical protein
MYALAASAAGVGVLALVQPTEAKIVYTPAHRHILFHHPLGLDLNRDGIVDFRISRHRFYDTQSAYATAVSAEGASQQNNVAGLPGFTYNSNYYASAYALRGGRQIGPKLHFPRPSPSNGLMGVKWGLGGGIYKCFRPWNNVKNRYLGLQFAIKGKIHYGWARLNEFCNPSGGPGTGAEALLTGYAYETIPNKPIVAGRTKGPDVITVESGSLGRLARGSAGRSEK